ncbi:MlaD family protein [Sulfurimonas sp.]
MNNKVNYTLVGILVLVGITLILSFTYWMLKPSADKETQKYRIYFNESVLGLNLDAPVKYRGITVGKVTNLRINPKNTEQVEVTVTILKTTPIKENTVAKLTAQGITGLTYINLTQGANDAPPLKAKDGEECPVIKSVPSFFEHFERSLGSVSSKLSSTLERTNILLSEKNQQEITKTLERTANVMRKIDRLLNEKTIMHFQNTVANIDSFTYKLDRVMPNVDLFIDKSIIWEGNIADSLGTISQSYLSIQASMNEFKRAVSSGEFNLKAISNDFVPTMNNSFLEMQGVMVELQELLQHYQRSPADILYKEEAIQKAPGEK